MTSILDFDRQRFVEGFDARPMAVRHSFADHPLLTLPALAQLADALPTEFVERNRGDMPLLAPDGGSERGGIESAGEVVLSLATTRTWMVLWDIEQMPEYRRLLDDCLDEVAPLLPAAEGTMRRREAFLFLSSAGSQTPAHFDPEHNLLLHIAGEKEMNVGRFSDPATEAAELARYYDGGHRNVGSMPPLDEQFLMRPGDGVYVPMFRPHWVRVREDAVSVSLSITFRTARSERAELAHTLNARLRRVGLHPRPPGRSARVDRAKELAMRGYARACGRQANPGLLDVPR